MADTGRSAHPYPFFLAQSLQLPIDRFDELLGPPGGWQIEWKWDGIRAQVVKRSGEVAVWSRGEELVTERFPEVAAGAQLLPDGTVLDGEIVVWCNGAVQPFARLQQRLGRKSLSAKLLADIPVCLLAFDLLEWREEDWRRRQQSERRAMLEQLLESLSQESALPESASPERVSPQRVSRDAHPGPALRLSPLLSGAGWQQLDEQRQGSRSRGVEGMMLKSKTACYGVGRTTEAGAWWKWKIEPFRVDAVLIYAQRGHGRRAGLYSDYTFAVWDRPAHPHALSTDAPPAESRRLVPFAKAYSGLTDAEIREVDAIIRRTTIETFGPVRSVSPTMVFELGFEGIALSSRHKSGIAVRFPRMLRWRQDKPIAEADTLQTLSALLAPTAGG